VLALIPVPFASGVAASPDGQHVYVTEAQASRVAVINVKTNSVDASLPIGWIPLAVAVSGDGARAFITEWGGGGEGTTVHVLDTATNVELGIQSVGMTPLDIATGFVPTVSSRSTSTAVRP
jgi:YVTN family beta-propeller protein